MDLEQLVGANEIAARLHAKKGSVVHDWRRRYDDFPPPAATISGVHIWLWADVAAWAKKTGRL